jgi:hypothetical protein
MGWTPFADAESDLGTRLHRKVASGDVPVYTDAAGRRFVWLQRGGGSTDDVLWEVLAELRRVREALSRLEAQVQGGERERTRTAGKVVSLSSGACRRLESLLDEAA